MNDERTTEPYVLRTGRPPRILLFSPGNGCLSRMAEGFLRAHIRANVEIFSSGPESGPVDSLADVVMQEVGIDILGYRVNPLEKISTLDFDIVITLCGSPDKVRPILPGYPARVNWCIPELASVLLTSGVSLRFFREVRDSIRLLTDDFVAQGCTTSFEDVRNRTVLALNTISVGVVAFDPQCRVFFFNSAAQAITGYTREEAINNHCRAVAMQALCNGLSVATGDGYTPKCDIEEYECGITTKSGEQKQVSASVRPILDSHRQQAGRLVSFRELSPRQYQVERAESPRAYFSGIIGRNQKMLSLYDVIRELSEEENPFMIQGEPGTGKELIAAAIHSEGPRHARPFVPVHCGAMAESLLKFELFGHRRVSLKGEVHDTQGQIELAEGGTIFLTEVENLSSALQKELLRVLREDRIERVGGRETYPVDVRIISTTTKDIRTEITQGRFSEDLFCSLSSRLLVIPALRERRDDIPLLADYLLNRTLCDMNRTSVVVSPAALDFMISYDWPGNVRELQNVLLFALAKCQGDTVMPEHLPPFFKGITRSATNRRTTDNWGRVVTFR